MSARTARSIAGAESSKSPLPPQSLAAYLHQQGLSQRALARQLGVDQSMISMLVQGKRAAGGRLAVRLHELTGIPIKVLVAAPTTPRQPRSRSRSRPRGPRRRGTRAPPAVRLTPFGTPIYIRASER